MTGAIRAVLFDIGGVVVGSPIVGISRFERKLQLPPCVPGDCIVADFVQKLPERARDGAWTRGRFSTARTR